MRERFSPKGTVTRQSVFMLKILTNDAASEHGIRGDISSVHTVQSGPEIERKEAAISTEY